MSNIQVAVRIRPLNVKEIAEGKTSVIYKQIVQNRQQVVIETRNKTFAFNRVFDQDVNQKQIYDETTAHMVGKLFEGYNATILAYGQSGSGKTYTMGTACNANENSQVVGIVPRAVKHIFDKISEMQNHYVQVSCSFFEVYNHVIYDLLSGEARDKSVRELLDKNVNKLTEKQVVSPKECLVELMRGSAQRTTGATSMNKQSSRSHAIFSITLRVNPKGDEGNETTSHFKLVDLAGSERCTKTKAQGERFKEGANNNLDLLVLGNVITSLCYKKSHIPYRNSILTRILQDSLGGNSITLMIACVGPADVDMDESLYTLRYAKSAKNIHNKPVVNINPDQAVLKLLDKDPISNQETNNNNLELGATLSEQVLKTNIMQLRDYVMKYFSDKPEASEVLEELKKSFKSIDEVMQRYRVDKVLTLFNDADFEAHSEVRKMKEDNLEKKKQLADMKKNEVMNQQIHRKMQKAHATYKRLQSAVKKQRDEKSDNAVKIFEHEMDVIHSVIDARHSVKQLTEDRALLNLRMEELKKCDDANPKEIKNLQQELELRMAQIQEIQNQVIAIDIDGKIKELCDRMQTTSDLKAVFRTMVKNSVTAHQQSVEFLNQMDDLKAHTEMIEEENASLKEQLSRAKNKMKMITWLTRQNSTELSNVTGDSHQSFNSASRQMSGMMNRERFKESENQLTEDSTGAYTFEVELSPNRERNKEAEDQLTETRTGANASEEKINKRIRDYCRCRLTKCEDNRCSCKKSKPPKKCTIKCQCNKENCENKN